MKWNFTTQFIYDTRHDHFILSGSQDCEDSSCFANDMTFRYDVDNDHLWYIRAHAWINPGFGGFTRFRRNEVLNWWEIQECDLDVDEYDPRPWPLLAEITTDEFDHPVLNWDPPLNWNTVQSYEVERAILKSPGANAFQTIHTETNVNNRSYTDTELFVVDPPAGLVSQYRIKAIFVPAETSTPEYSNIQKINVSKWPSLVVDETPSEYTLFQNHPNPFNPVTAIRYRLPVDSPVRLTLYNSVGQHVAELVDTYLAAGDHEYVLDATKLSAGVYFYRLTAGKFSATQKLILAK